jgi:hypothetical protein
MRRRVIPAVACLASIAVISGCVYDAARPVMSYKNELDVTVVIEVEGADRPTELTLESGESTHFGLEGCLGSAIL